MLALRREDERLLSASDAQIDDSAVTQKGFCQAGIVNDFGEERLACVGVFGVFCLHDVSRASLRESHVHCPFCCRGGMGKRGEGEK